MPGLRIRILVRSVLVNPGLICKGLEIEEMGTKMVAGWFLRTSKLWSRILRVFVLAPVAEPTLPSLEILTDGLKRS